MKRRTLLATLGSSAVAVSGCLGDGGETGSNETEPALTMPSVEPVDDGQPRPNCAVEPEYVEVGDPADPTTHEIVGTIPYPEPPAEFTADQVVSFVEEHERAYIRHDSICPTDDGGLLTSYYYDVRRSWTVDTDTAGTTVLLIYVGGPSTGVTKDGYTWAAGLGPTGVVYNVTENRAARARFMKLPQLESDAEIAEKMPDPIEDGEVAVRF